MKPASEFFTAEEQQKIIAAVKAAEEKTSGEIVPMVVDSSYDYPRAELIGAGSLALAIGLMASWMFGGDSIWVFLPTFVLCYLLLQQLIRRFPDLKRKLIHPDELTTEVKEKAMVSFLELGLHETRDRTGILILISLFEHRVQVLADSGINEQVPEQTWDEIVAMIVAGIKSNDAGTAVCRAVERCGELLASHLPVKNDDSDELPNLILE